jgi:hypothetical protein
LVGEQVFQRFSRHLIGDESADDRTTSDVAHEAPFRFPMRKTPMMNRTRTGIVLLVLAQALVGCGADSSSTPLAPSVVPQLTPPAPQPTPIQLAVFSDAASGFSTVDVRDVQEQVVRFNTAGELIWTADDTRFPGYPVNGNFVRRDHYYQVRFATRDSERRAYFCGHGHDDVTDPPSICDIEVVRGQLVITETGELCPGVRE